jgi:hypothetical protein
MSQEILINSVLVASNKSFIPYEFVLNTQLTVTECVRVESITDNSVTPIFNAPNALEGMLFELNHVRVNPRVNNTEIIAVLTCALNKIGVAVFNPPTNNDVASCFKPMGEISDNVRFYLDLRGRVVFLSPNTKPRLINDPKNQQYLNSIK